MEAESSIASVEDQRDTHSRPQFRSGQEGRDISTSFKLPASARCISIIPEIRWKIFQLIHDASDNHNARHLGNKTLLALALTCKSFTGPALKLLWQDLSELAPLIKCLPRSLWKQVEKIGISKSHDLR
ncbi:hypothetical protein DFJ58DRAFT_228911 [Suillus subalutaceus]|uniref:uncharacterized protein n=1 Tax=Suillus subalutaceus TaxID=48586 RepID=UPI001B87BCC6|nr:uncharacterized protein DFJ58DRAFT_228911 [Suillus subalutaceus]KAG1833234.1 hypothetical protein DFJ58DRAFT_228911 [Suillus subalutaceus]